MMYARKANRIRQVAEHEVEKYLDLGYDITDEAGNILKSAIPTDVSLLQKYYVEHTAKIAELEQTIASMKAKPVKSAPVETDEVATVTDAPKKSRKSAKEAE